MIVKFKNNTRKINFERVLIMGIVNASFDSFSDGGEYQQSQETIIQQALKLIEQGADIIDIGGESSRPGAENISLEEELKRTIPIIKTLRTLSDVLISIDTTKSQIAKQALENGADIVNDISGFHHDPLILEVIAKYQVPAIAMHRKGNAKTMQSLAKYQNLRKEINDYFKDIINRWKEYSLKKDYLILDPGIGFSKKTEHNLEILANLEDFSVHGHRLLVGPSRKSFIGEILKEKQPKKRLWGTAAVVTCAVINKANIIRVHDISEMKQVIQISGAILKAKKGNFNLKK